MAILIENELDAKYENFRTQAKRLDDRCQNSIDEMAAISVDSEAIIALYRYLTQVKARLTLFAAVPGIVQHVKDAEGNQSYDISTEITALQAEMAAAMTWVEDNFPSSGDYLLFLRIVDTVITPRLFSPAQTAGLRTELQGVVDAIG